MRRAFARRRWRRESRKRSKLHSIRRLHTQVRQSSVNSRGVCGTSAAVVEIAATGFTFERMAGAGGRK
jgi:hypothetical protein